MSKRLVKIAKELNVGTGSIVDFLANSGFEVDNKPTAKVSDEMYDLLVQEFRGSMSVKEQADQLIIGTNRQVPEKEEEEKKSPFEEEPELKEVEKQEDQEGEAEEEQEEKEEKKEKSPSGLKVVGKIDLNKKPKKKEKEEEKEEVKEESKEEVAEEVTEKKSVEPQSDEKLSLIHI